MRAAGIIAEYNPFHNGHERHIRETRKRTGCDCVIVAMNGSISQRGEMMIADKWTRAEMALRGGADIVVELPVLWGARPAENFAAGGVAILHALGCKWLSFGCETEDISLLDKLCSLLEKEEEEYKQLLREALAQGKSFARARGEALDKITGAGEELLSAPNAALALEYMRSIRKFGSAMEPVAVLRGASHHAKEIAKETSASAIRQAIYAERTDDAAEAMPETAFSLLKRNIGSVPDGKNVDIALLTSLRAMNKEQIARLPDVAEGLENALWKAGRESGTRDALLARLKSKRYTHARLSRIAAHAMIETDRSLIDLRPVPHYIRLLGLRKEAFGALAYLQKNSALPIVDRGKALEGDAVFELERRATDTRALLSQDAACRAADTDLTHKLVVV